MEERDFINWVNSNYERIRDERFEDYFIYNIDEDDYYYNFLVDLGITKEEMTKLLNEIKKNEIDFTGKEISDFLQLNEEQELAFKNELVNISDLYSDDFLEEEFYQELDKQYDIAFDWFYQNLEKIKKYINSKELKESCYIDFERTHSWAPGRFPSYYFTVQFLDENNDEINSFVIRFCDGHENGNSSEAQFNAFESYHREFVIDLIDLFEENLEDGSQEQFKELEKLCAVFKN